MIVDGKTLHRSRALCGLAAGLVIVGAAGCRSVTEVPAPPPAAAGLWDLTRAERLAWRSDDPGFGQDFALETSGLAFSGHHLIASSEKYARLLVMDPADGLRARALAVDVPVHSELEGVAWYDGALYLCDEANAAVYRVEFGDETLLTRGREGPPLTAAPVPFEGLELAGGKIGVEGIEVTPDGRHMMLLLERSRGEDGSCRSRIWRLRIDRQRLLLDGDAVDVALEDCNWRLTGLAWMGDALIGLKTQFPGERYEIVEIDQATGDATVLLDLTDYLRGVRADGWGNNVEGIAVDAVGDLWLIADNAVTGVIDDPYPPRTDEKALLLRIPRRTD